jgi:hypothetical protein
MPQVGFEPTIPVSERAKRVHALDGEATVSGISGNYEDGRAAPNASLNHDVTDPFC